MPTLIHFMPPTRNERGRSRTRPLLAERARGPRLGGLGLGGRRLVRLRRNENQPAVDREGFEFDAEALAAGMGPGRADPGPDSTLPLAAVLDRVGDERWFRSHDVLLC